jgi:hypothetical protein
MSRSAKSKMPSDLDLVLAALDDDDFAAAVRHLRGVADPESVLTQLAKSRREGPRGYVTPLATELLPRDRAIPLVRRMLDDSDSSNRIDAVAAYAALDPEGVPRLLGKLRKRLRSMSDHEVLSTAWTLATIGDAEPAAEIAAEIAAVRDVEDPSLWLTKALDVVWTYMSAPDRVISRIHEHDHDSMLWLTYAAALIGTEEAKAALQACAAAAPDDRCRGLCQNNLE